MPKILAIDNNNDNLISLKAIIDNVFPSSVVFTALNGSKGIELAIANNPDVILIGLILPDMNSVEVCFQLKRDERTRYIPVVFLTTMKEGRETRNKALEAGAEAFLSKPIDEIELTALIRAMVKIKTANEQKRDEKVKLEKVVEEQTLALQEELQERKRTELELLASEEKYRTMVDLLPDAVIIHSGGKFVFANAAALKTVGADSFEQLIKRPLMDYVHPDFRAVSLSRIMEIYSTGQPSTFSEEKFITLNDEVIDVEVIGTPVMYMGKPAIQTIIRDITERKKAEAALKESEERFKYLFESSNVAESITSLSGEINVNQAFCDLFGYTQAELKGKKWQEVTHPEEVEIDQKLIDSILRGEKNAARRIKRYIHKSGKTICGDVSYALIRDLKRNPLYFITTIIDITDRKRAEDELRENVARLELAMSTAKMSWWEMDMATGQVTFEKRKAEMLGYAPEKFKHYTDFTVLVHPEDQERAMEAMRQHLNGSLDKYEIEYRIKTISGEYKWFYDIGSVTKRDSEGNPLIVSGLVLNISERKQADEELQKSHKMLEKLTAQVPGVVYQYRLYPDGRSAFPFSSPGMYDIYEVTPDEVREDASPVFTRIHPDDYDYIVETITESARNQTIYHSEFRVILPKQGLRWRMSDAKPELLEDGSTLWHGIITDITERKQNEEALLEREQLFKGLFNASPDAIVLMDTNNPTISWPIIDCNEAACWMNGYTREEMIGHSIDMLHKSEGLPEEREIYYNDLKREGVLHREHIHRHKDGHLFPIESSTTIVTVGRNEMVLGIDRDITERKQAEFELIQAKEKAQESDRLKSAFLANMSHEIRTPLNSIIGFSDLLFDPEFGEEEKKSFAENISLSGNSLLAIISDIMDLSKIETGLVQINRSRFSINRIVSDLHREYSFKASKKGIELRIDSFNSEEIYIESDQEKLRQVLINLVSNALKFTESGYIEMGIRDQCESIVFQVKDTGIGIPEEYHDKVFERFRQVESAKSRKYGGNGLGLAISKSLVEMLGGKIWIESVQGKGSTFYFTIPKEG